VLSAVFLVEAAAAVCAALSVAPIFPKSVAAVVISSGAAITLDIAHLPPAHHDPAVAQLR
jgi:hypothetical protein